MALFIVCLNRGKRIKQFFTSLNRSKTIPVEEIIPGTKTALQELPERAANEILLETAQMLRRAKAP